MDLGTISIGRLDGTRGTQAKCTDREQSRGVFAVGHLPAKSSSIGPRGTLNAVSALRVRGSQIVDQAGQSVVLRGFGLGGWMNMENFITGYPANEQAHREALRAVIGDELATLFFDRFLATFFTEADARFIKSLGLNLVRLPLNYRHFEDDIAPFVLKAEGFEHLDRVVDACARNGIYTILDLHAAPGYQNQHWHSDNPTHMALFWEHKHFQDRAVWLWERLAEHYRSNDWVAGYNVLNEPSDPTEQRIEPFYHRAAQAIRAIDPDHMLFLEGNRYSIDFHMFFTSRCRMSCRPITTTRCPDSSTRAHTQASAVASTSTGRC
jgi:endoglucanase